MALNINEARKHILDLGTPREGLYCVDFFISYAIGIGGILTAYPHSFSSATFWLWIGVSLLGLYRAMSFTHEISHFRQRLPVFRKLWNGLAGVPMAFPSFMYMKSHAIHHNPKTYATKADGEYIPFHLISRWHTVLYVVSALWTPPLLVLRFAALYPLSLVSKPIRKFVVERGSSVVITLNHKGEWPKGSEVREWLIMETACCVFWWCLLALCFWEVLPWRLLGAAYFSMVGALILNSMRTLAAHRFANDGKTLSIEEQLLDSVNIDAGFPGWVLSALAAPVGLRFHALHHLFPFLPYHSLGEAHRRLTRSLPKESSYHRSSEKGILIACAKLWSRQ